MSLVQQISRCCGSGMLARAGCGDHFEELLRSGQLSYCVGTQAVHVDIFGEAVICSALCCSSAFCRGTLTLFELDTVDVCSDHFVSGCT